MMTLFTFFLLLLHLKTSSLIITQKHHNAPSTPSMCCCCCCFSLVVSDCKTVGLNQNCVYCRWGLLVIKWTDALVVLPGFLVFKSWQTRLKCSKQQTFECWKISKNTLNNIFCTKFSPQAKEYKHVSCTCCLMFLHHRRVKKWFH